MAEQVALLATSLRLYLERRQRAGEHRQGHRRAALLWRWLGGGNTAETITAIRS